MAPTAELGKASASQIETLLYCIKSMGDAEQKELFRTKFKYGEVKHALRLTSTTSEQGLREKMTGLLEVINNLPANTAGKIGKKDFPAKFFDEDTDSPAGPSTRAASVQQSAPQEADAIMSDNTTQPTASSSKGKGKEPVPPPSDLDAANMNLAKSTAIMAQSFGSITESFEHAKASTEKFARDLQQQQMAFQAAVSAAQQQCDAVLTAVSVPQQQPRYENSNTAFFEGNANTPTDADAFKEQYPDEVNAAGPNSFGYPGYYGASNENLQWEHEALQTALAASLQQSGLPNAGALEGNDDFEADEANNGGNDA